mgnify:CR=1 FL=1
MKICIKTLMALAVGLMIAGSSVGFAAPFYPCKEYCTPENGVGICSPYPKCCSGEEKVGCSCGPWERFCNDGTL